MSWIVIPFSREMGRAILEGRKICTTRKEKMGEVGDYFIVSGKAYRIVWIEWVTLETVRDHLYALEGCGSPAEFEALWKRLHRGHFSGEKVYHLHWFARAEVGIDA